MNYTVTFEGKPTGKGLEVSITGKFVEGFLTSCILSLAATKRYRDEVFNAVLFLMGIDEEDEQKKMKQLLIENMAVLGEESSYE